MIAQAPLLITTGEPAGIGMDIVLMLADKGKLESQRPIVVLADKNAFEQRQQQLLANHSLSKSIVFNNIDVQDLANLTPNAPNHNFYLLPIPTQHPVTVGVLDVANAPMVLAQLQLAHDLAMRGQVAGIVTAPLQKSVIMTLDPHFMGHTEFFMEQAGLDKVVMMLANQTMKVALVTTHLPLKDVPNAITQDEVRKTVQIVLADCQMKFGLKNPKILVCGLNPHAGEHGHLGTEERDVINPVLQGFINQGVDISLAMPADTLFTKKYVSQADTIIAMYHDQGLAPLKSHGFGETVNITLGLPYIRTSVDHGTALDLAGTGQASAESLYHAIIYANQMAGDAY
ncbi:MULTISPECIES: 4-hydroxythreonine-4-phosphate dehydrogenase PdxA [unclassified Moraxella]|uniref:4-hydroxythreonine-4-phosphate dehydrogenase PdxA n=1 Tax=unclassified Moraxella TaxID=2685852 RepID=UPI003AF7373D